MNPNETQRLHALNDLKFLDTLEDGGRFDRITRLATRIFDVPIAWVGLTAQAGGAARLPEDLTVREVAQFQALSEQALLSEDPFVVRDMRNLRTLGATPGVGRGICFYAGHAVHAADWSRVGTLALMDRKPREFTAADLAQLADLAGMIDRELSLLSLATIDPLTRLLNRRGFLEIASHMLMFCRREQSPATVVAIDLDGFKVINDRQGHAAGDAVLREFARLLLKSFRSSDVVARPGGDEFYVLVSGANRQVTEMALERLGRGFRSSDLHRAQPGLSWSAGAAELDLSGTDGIEALVAEADRRMYGVKQSGSERHAAG